MRICLLISELLFAFATKSYSADTFRWTGIPASWKELPSGAKAPGATQQERRTSAERTNKKVVRRRKRSRGGTAGKEVRGTLAIADQVTGKYYERSDLHLQISDRTARGGTTTRATRFWVPATRLWVAATRCRSGFVTAKLAYGHFRYPSSLLDRYSSRLQAPCGRI